MTCSYWVYLFVDNDCTQFTQPHKKLALFESNFKLLKLTFLIIYYIFFFYCMFSGCWLTVVEGSISYTSVSNFCGSSYGLCFNIRTGLTHSSTIQGVTDRQQLPTVYHTVLSQLGHVLTLIQVLKNRHVLYQPYTCTCTICHRNIMFIWMFDWQLGNIYAAWRPQISWQ